MSNLKSIYLAMKIMMNNDGKLLIESAIRWKEKQLACENIILYIIAIDAQSER